MTPDGGPPPSTDAGAPVGPLSRLLEVQDHDTVIDQLRHRRATLPERSDLAAVEGELAALDGRTQEVRGSRDELGARQGALEQQIEGARVRRATIEKRLYGGEVAAARELQAMSEEVKHLARHIGELEDRELEVMEAIEPLDAELAEGDERRRALEHRAAGLRRAIDEAAGAIDADIAEQERVRAAAAGEVGAPLLERYEQLRRKLGGTGAARLVGTSCGGCHLVLPAMEIDRIRKASADAVITCDQCGRILVR